MAGRLAREIRQNKPFESIEEEAILNVARTSEILMQVCAAFLKSYGPSPTQYNVLRILRGAGKDGLTCSQLSERTIARDPDITRLLDRMEARGWVVRARGKQDRRIVLTHISEAGLQLTKEIDRPIRAMLKRSLAKVGKGELSSLIETLDKDTGKLRVIPANGNSRDHIYRLEAYYWMSKEKLMSDIAKLDQDLNEKILTGKAMEGFETYYTDDVVMQENSDAPSGGAAVERRQNCTRTVFLQQRVMREREVVIPVRL